MQQNLHFLADLWNLAHLLPSIKLMIIARRTATYNTTIQTNGIQACYDSSFNTLRLDSTHPDTYNLVGFSGCLHLWWIPLLNPELLISELCVISVTMNQISLTTSYTDGAPPWTPTNRGHGITSRPLERNPESLT
ncbi:hypothetical protein DEO72_LG9g1155 [Vigna unguiculata]|uniref:Uncharacterized protein n=1 Tax=Vigna unguiculata TaxID=3917 RepID=A0A4D6MZR1_VIGUN|nr:hypothetical protein DEO72_LG9g1155 [Vigna unguiculata]